MIASRKDAKVFEFGMDSAQRLWYSWRMALSRDAWRRWLGGICLAISASMLILGMTVLKDRLRPQTFLYYWLICMLITALTLLIAILDLRAVRLRSQREEAELVDSTLEEIRREKERRANRGKPPG